MSRKDVLMEALAGEYPEEFLEWWADFTEDDGKEEGDWYMARIWAYDGWQEGRKTDEVQVDVSLQSLNK